MTTSIATELTGGAFAAIEVAFDDWATFRYPADAMEIAARVRELGAGDAPLTNARELLAVLTAGLATEWHAVPDRAVILAYPFAADS